VEPIPETREALESLRIESGERGLEENLRRMALRVRALVPECIGLSLASVSHGLTFTVVATDADIAVLDSVQYLFGGPCVSAADEERTVLMEESQLMDEERWRDFAAASAAKAVSSTLTLPQVQHGAVVGTVNLYAGAPQAFDDQVEALAALLGAWAPGAIANADLSFRTREEARRAPQLLEEQATIARAVGMLAAREGIDPTTAKQRLRDAALRAGVTDHALARLILEKPR
jgi:GAF domain-containing protein